jgi:hypothetical protein
MKNRNLWGTFSVLLLGGVLAWAGQAVSIEPVDGGRGTSDPSPDCNADGVYCNWVNAVVPAGSQIDKVTVYASIDSSNWTTCTESPTGRYMNCGQGVRFLNTSPGISPSKGGFNVTWRMLNATTHKQWGKLVVDYH